MNKSICMLIVALVTVCGCGKNVVETESGLLKGVPSDAGSDVTVFKGVPFAAAPVGELRWKAPQSAPVWKGVKVADTFGPAAWQPFSDNHEGDLYWYEFYTGGYPQVSEDCLTLDIWKPADAGTLSKLPVAVWIHGGALQSGWSSEIEFSGEDWARSGVILVSINYRLAEFGFFLHPSVLDEDPESAGNFGFLDQIAALKWVKRNIAAFGGDPDNVMIFGQSAGAMSVMNLVSSPLAAGLFNKAAMQSGGFASDNMLGARSVEGSLYATGALAAAAGTDDIAALRSLSAEEVHSFAEQARSAIPFPFPWWNTANGTSFPDFRQAYPAGAVADVPYLLGGVAGDWLGLGDGMDEFAAARAAAGGKPVYVYNFNRALPGEIQAGAFHACELWYMFGTMEYSSRPFTDDDLRLSRDMVRYWTDFAKTGNPGGEWKAWTEENPNHMIFNAE